MKTTMYKAAATAAALAAALLTGCSGGGGASSIPSNPTMPAPPVMQASMAPVTPTPVGPPQTSAPVNPTPTPAGTNPSPMPTSTVGMPSTPPPTPMPVSPTPIVTAVPMAQQVVLSGKIVNHDTGAALQGAVVYVSHNLVPGATAPMAAPADGGEVTTNASGQYTMTLPAQSSYPSRFFLEAFTPGMVTVHAIVTVTATGANTAPTFGETTLSSDEQAWLNLVNQDRAQWNAAPLVADETLEEVARLWVGWLGQGHFEHTCSSGDVNCPDKVGYSNSETPPDTGSAENIGQRYQSFQSVDSAFMAEQANCPQPTNPQTCPFTENTGHFLNTVNQTAIWYGAAEDLTGVDSSGQNASSFDEEFSYENISYGNMINSHSQMRPAAVQSTGFRSVVPL